MLPWYLGSSLEEKQVRVELEGSLALPEELGWAPGVEVEEGSLWKA